MKTQYPIIYTAIKNYVQLVFAERLTKAGFSPSHDSELQWIRVTEGGIFQSVSFYTRLPWESSIMLNIGVGIHPLFVRPVYLPDVYLYGPWREDMVFDFFTLMPTVGASERVIHCAFREDIPVMCPNDLSRGGATWDDVLLPILEGSRNLKRCYAYHIQKIEGRTMYPMEVRYNAVSAGCIAEGIILQDQSRYPYFMRRINELSKRESFPEWNYLSDRDVQLLKKELQLQFNAMTANQMESYLDFLKEQEKLNSEELYQKTGCRCCASTFPDNITP